MKTTERSPFLSALCILTFIGSGIGFLGYFYLSLFFEKASGLIVSIGNIQSMDKVTPCYFLILMVLYALSLTGAIRMWKLHRDGYFLYITVQLLILFLPVVQLGWGAFYFTNAIFTMVFIVGYSLNYKFFKR